MEEMTETIITDLKQRIEAFNEWSIENDDDGDFGINVAFQEDIQEMMREVIRQSYEKGFEDGQDSITEAIR